MIHAFTIALEFVACWVLFSGLAIAGFAVVIGGIIHAPDFILMQGGAASKDRLARVAHNHEVVGSNPTPATKLEVELKPRNRPGHKPEIIKVQPLVAPPANGGSEISPASFIEPKDLMDETVCSWCQREQAIKAQPHESHGICQRHKAMMLAEAKRFSRSAYT